MRLLLDANVLIALTNRSHIHHERARQWFGNKERMFTTCPVTQGALVSSFFHSRIAAKSHEGLSVITTSNAYR